MAMTRLVHRTAGLAGSAAILLLFAGGSAEAQIRKTCGQGVALKLSAAGAVQGSLLLAEVTGAKGLIKPQAEWDGKPAPLWSETGSSSVLHGLLGVDLEKKPGRYEWKLSWQDAKGNPV